ncbi:MAG: hypothetical protein HYT49_01675 [Candidatus Wildermuthbacteria bacterium]|nr:hypothetical protein [Candidatus Wildermuthbacteria bacterium]
MELSTRTSYFVKERNGFPYLSPADGPQLALERCCYLNLIEVIPGRGGEFICPICGALWAMNEETVNGLFREVYSNTKTGQRFARKEGSPRDYFVPLNQ